jgi:hypothetical protein
MMNIFVFFIVVMTAPTSLFAAASVFHSSSYEETVHLEKRIVGVDSDIKREIYEILDGKLSINPDGRYLERLEEIGGNIGCETLALFCKTLGDFYSEKGVYDKAGKSYFKALSLQVYDEELRYFISNVLGIRPTSSAEKITKALAELHASKRS